MRWTLESNSNVAWKGHVLPICELWYGIHHVEHKDGETNEHRRVSWQGNYVAFGGGVVEGTSMIC